MYTQTSMSGQGVTDVDPLRRAGLGLAQLLEHPNVRRGHILSQSSGQIFAAPPSLLGAAASAASWMVSAAGLGLATAPPSPLETAIT